ncbi:hypothetical protein [Candidatus Nitrosotenuis sp. DW1]|uniref:hypothetical protein n=1 Tax=Candidatus Nitrosotenuis sp. DW1 TaxID=2259672 RepID=UPI0015C74E8D|nr:hypothetical protein [Candidatus Nitrosotenuis sp. DW1]QLH08100.1 hypothetical protein DSQ19_00130 [Candidatus Nitrosotenuis sp. DW1]
MFLNKTAFASFAMIAILSAISTSFAETVDTQTTITPINSSIGLEKTIVPFHAPKENKLPWGFVEGKIASPVEEYPVIIQIYKNGEAVHFAQTDVKKDGSYEYKFRVRDVTNDVVTKIFEGDYTVKIFKVVYLDKSSTFA